MINIQTSQEQEYQLSQRVTAGTPPQVQMATARFTARDEAELRKLVRLFMEGGMDEAIEEEMPPGHVYGLGNLKIETVGFTAADGQDMMGLWREVAGEVLCGAQ